MMMEEEARWRLKSRAIGSSVEIATLSTFTIFLVIGAIKNFVGNQRRPGAYSSRAGSYKERS
jgi:hypothetical protein